MTKTLNATVVNGTMQFDEPLSLPEHSRVSVTVTSNEQPRSDEVSRRIEAVKKFRAWSDANPLFDDGERLTREQLHERR